MACANSDRIPINYILKMFQCSHYGKGLLVGYRILELRRVERTARIGNHLGSLTLKGLHQDSTNTKGRSVSTQGER